jgi:hypothetical protein
MMMTITIASIVHLKILQLFSVMRDVPAIGADDDARSSVLASL